MAISRSKKLIPKKRRVSLLQRAIISFLNSQPDKTALNTVIAKAVGRKRPGNISATLTLLNKHQLITRPDRNVSVYTGKKRMT